jgi:hypothetical protein
VDVIVARAFGVSVHKDAGAVVRRGRLDKPHSPLGSARKPVPLLLATLLITVTLAIVAFVFLSVFMPTEPFPCIKTWSRVPMAEPVGPGGKTSMPLEPLFDTVTSAIRNVVVPGVG